VEACDESWLPRSNAVALAGFAITTTSNVVSFIFWGFRQEFVKLGDRVWASGCSVFCFHFGKVIELA